MNLKSFGLIALTLAAFNWIGCAAMLATSPQENSIAPETERAGGLFSSGKYRSIAVADLNNDGNLDVAGGSTTPGGVGIWYGDGRGGFSEPEFLPFRGDVRSLAIADIDKDGYKDIICSVQRESSGILVWLNRSGQRWERGDSPVETGNYEGLAAGDVNGDGFPDIVAANSTSDDQGGVQVWLGDGKGGWRAESGPSVKGVYMDVVLADFDRDGSLDIAASGWGTYGGLRVWYGDGTGGWSSPSELAKGSYYGLTIADLNADGRLDILAATYRAGLQIFLSLGTGGFYRDKSPSETGSFWKVLLLDMQADGSKMLLASSLDSTGILAWQRRDSDAWLPVSSLFPSSGNYYGIAFGDLNRDGRADFCAASFGQGIKVWLGKAAVAEADAIISSKVSVATKPVEIADIEENEVFRTVSGVSEYKIGPGDIIEIHLWRGIEKTTEELPVRPNGKISFGFVEDLYINGLTVTELDDLLTQKLGEFIKNPRIDITVKKFDSKFVTVMGAIDESPYRRSGPGKYELTGKTTLLEMITKSGGPAKDANLNEVSIRRKSGRSLTVDFYKIFTQRDLSLNIILDDGDMIYLPALSKEANRVFVFGEVEKPGVYTFTGSQMSLFDVISQAGGVTVFAKQNSTKVVRGDITRPEVISVNLGNLLETGDQTQNVALANKDLIYVPRSFVGDINRFVKQITPLMRLIIYPAQVINEFGTAGEWLEITTAP